MTNIPVEGFKISVPTRSSSRTHNISAENTMEIYFSQMMRITQNQFLNPTICSENLQSRIATGVTQPAKGQQPGGIDKDDLYRNDQWFRCMVKCYHSIVVLHDQQWLHQP